MCNKVPVCQHVYEFFASIKEATACMMCSSVIGASKSAGVQAMHSGRLWMLLHVGHSSLRQGTVLMIILRSSHAWVVLGFKSTNEDEVLVLDDSPAPPCSMW